jgi:hypothetical protein
MDENDLNNYTNKNNNNINQVKIKNLYNINKKDQINEEEISRINPSNKNINNNNNNNNNSNSNSEIKINSNFELIQNDSKFSLLVRQDSNNLIKSINSNNNNNQKNIEMSLKEISNKKINRRNNNDNDNDNDNNNNDNLSEKSNPFQLDFANPSNKKNNIQYKKYTEDNKNQKKSTIFNKKNTNMNLNSDKDKDLDKDKDKENNYLPKKTKTLKKTMTKKYKETDTNLCNQIETRYDRALYRKLTKREKIVKNLIRIRIEFIL